MNTQLKSYDPSTGKLLGEVPLTRLSDIDVIVSNAKQAAPKWKALGASARMNLVKDAFSRIEPHTHQLACLLSTEMGKDARRSMSEVGGSSYAASYIAEQAFSALQNSKIDRTTELHYQPLGVAAVISPWNYPMAMACNLIVPALVAGNTVIFKPSEETPLIAQAFIELVNEVLPAHVLQIVHGHGDIGQALVESDIDLIAFTGSMATGKDIMARAAGGLKRLVMELGGNDPMIVMNNANIEAAARFAVAGSLENTGQMCTSTERIYVDASIADSFEARVVQIASEFKAGAWNESGVHIGPIINKQQHNNVMRHIQDAVHNGATLLLGDLSQKPPYIRPTVIADMTPEMLIEQEETFGPVIAISRFESIDEAIQRANNSVYGLGAVVFGAQGSKEVAEQLEAGMVAINQGVGGNGDSPWVGAKHSGYGFHGSAAGHRQFAQVRLLSHR
ncbi:aldehyde dehydrogenase [Pontibacterium sp. N1Y112]|uniref:Aldehyde dehydrogenase n=1 Tax=Pontibacterium sinense TaxID=2781979 RepID=A0A8J7FE02_9GAMM|nr:aldehyde dehydrogenase family protein [Pontibacterium sinense]MBE9399715.1 aldehyde dehydrogenase [Pontibacterium sinense]